MPTSGTEGLRELTYLGSSHGTPGIRRSRVLVIAIGTALAAELFGGRFRSGARPETGSAGRGTRLPRRRAPPRAGSPPKGDATSSQTVRGGSRREEAGPE